MNGSDCIFSGKFCLSESISGKFLRLEKEVIKERSLVAIG